MSATKAAAPTGAREHAIARHFVGVAAALSVACGTLLAFLIRNAWFANDDFQNLSEAYRKGLTLDYLLWPTVKTRFSPGHRLVDWMVLEWPGEKWTAVMVLTGLFLALAVFMAALFVREATGSPLVALSAAALLGTWVGWVRVGSWWTAAAHLIPVVAFSIAALWAILLWDRRGRRARDLVLATVFAIAALSFSVRGVLIPLVAAVVLLVATPQTKSIRLRDIRNRLAQSWPPLVSTGMVAAIFAYVESQTPVNKANPPVTAVSVWADLVQKWFTNGVPALAINHVPFVDVRVLPLLAGLVVIAVLMAATIRGSRSAWIWASVFLLIAFFGIQVGWGRINYLGTTIALDARFREGDVLVAVVLIPLAWACSGEPRPRGSRQQAAAAIVASGAVIIWIVGLVTGTDAIWNAPQPSSQNPGVVPHRVFNRMKQTLIPALAADPDATIVNTKRPSGFLLGSKVNAEFSTGGVLSTLLPEARVSFWQPDGTPLLIESDGTARRLEVADIQPVGRRWPLCFATAPDSKWLGPGAAGTLFKLPAAAKGEARLLTVRFASTRQPGRIAISFVPKEGEGLPELITTIDTARRGLRIPVPVGATAASIGAWGGLSTCLSGASVSTISE